MRIKSPRACIEVFRSRRMGVSEKIDKNKHLRREESLGSDKRQPAPASFHVPSWNKSLGLFILENNEG
jgi:hypothetical protein